MKESNSSITTRDAAEILGFSTRHIQNMIKVGKLSATRTENGSFIIDKAEFYRVFPEKFTVELERTSANKEASGARTVLESEIKHLKDMMTEKEKHNEFLRQQIESMNSERKIILETLGSNQRLLEDKRESHKSRKKILGIF
ncbi:MAG TPA: helix-turn-helix domain-containing protein [Flavitalea sp.]|nr:helix-turn-helix domain-containing protein [Flavitalea sp.]